MAGSSHFQKPDKRLSQLVRNSTYRDACSDGFTAGEWEAHHIACHHAVDGREIEDNYLEYVEDCLWITDWNLNSSANLIGLPKNRQYRNSNGTNPVNYCSHQVDHNTKAGYTNECKSWLQLNLWNTLKDKKKKHEVTAKDIKSTLEKCTNTYKKKLSSRGSRKGGTLLGWQNRFDPAYELTWYYPFSMGMFPSKRHPGVNTSIADKMTNLFKKLF